MKTTLRKLTMAWPLAIFLLLPALTRAETAIQSLGPTLQRARELQHCQSRGGGRQQQRDRDGLFHWQRGQLGLRDDQVFERGRAALDQPLQRAGEWR